MAHSKSAEREQKATEESERRISSSNEKSKYPSNPPQAFGTSEVSKKRRSVFWSEENHLDQSSKRTKAEDFNLDIPDQHQDISLKVAEDILPVQPEERFGEVAQNDDDEEDEDNYTGGKHCSHADQAASSMVHLSLRPNLLQTSNPLGLHCRPSSSFLDLASYALENGGFIPRSPSTVDEDQAPLGRGLPLTPSVVDLLSIAIDKSTTACQLLKTGGVAIKDPARGKCTVSSEETVKKALKASTFHVSSLKVGAWEHVSQLPCDLIGKFQYGRKRIVWEVQEEGVKRKMEMEWDHISAMRASCPANLPSTLEIEFSHAPLFFKESATQTGEKTQWENCSDFTTGQASLCNLHSLLFPEGVLKRQFENLLQSDPQLKALVEGTPLRDSIDRANTGL